MDELIPIFGMVLTLGPLAVLAVSFTPLGRALSARLKGNITDLDDQLSIMKDELRRELLEEQSAQLEELHERLDFTERLLTDSRRRADAPDPIVTPV